MNHAMKRLALILVLLLAGIGQSIAQQTVTRVGPITPGDCASFQSPNSIQDGGVPCGAGHFANPTGAVGLTGVNGSATTSMRSDAAPPLSASVQSALTAPSTQILIGTGAFGFSSISAAGVDTNAATTRTGNYTVVNADCGNPQFLGGNALFTLTINAANTYTSNCQVILVNTDGYTGPGSGRGKLIAASGVTNFILYPGQKIAFRQNGTTWVPDPGPLAATFGQVWNAPAAVTFFTDTGGSDTANDGLASGASGAFQTLQKCANQAYNVVYTRNLGSVFCSNTAGQTQQAFLQIFYQLSGGGVLQFISATPGTPWTWKCVNSSLCLQLGDNALVSATDVTFSSVGVTTPQGLISGHNYGVLDLNTGVTLAGTTATPAITCDFDTHFNINNGLTYSNAHSSLFKGCQGSRWNINSAINSSGTTTITNIFSMQSGSYMTIQGNVTWGTTGLTAGQSVATGNSVVNNFAAAPPGGAPTPATGAQYCTTLC